MPYTICQKAKRIQVQMPNLMTLSQLIMCVFRGGVLLVSYLVSFAFIWRGTDRNLHLKIGIQFAFRGGSVLRSHHTNIRFLFLFFIFFLAELCKIRIERNGVELHSVCTHSSGTHCMQMENTEPVHKNIETTHIYGFSS